MQDFDQIRKGEVADEFIKAVKDIFERNSKIDSWFQLINEYQDEESEHLVSFRCETRVSGT